MNMAMSYSSLLLRQLLFTFLLFLLTKPDYPNIKRKYTSKKAKEGESRDYLGGEDKLWCWPQHSLLFFLIHSLPACKFLGNMGTWASTQDLWEVKSIKLQDFQKKSCRCKLKILIIPSWHFNFVGATFPVIYHATTLLPLFMSESSHPWKSWGARAQSCRLHTKISILDLFHFCYIISGLLTPYHSLITNSPSPSHFRKEELKFQKYMVNNVLAIANYLTNHNPSYHNSNTKNRNNYC